MARSALLWVALSLCTGNAWAQPRCDVLLITNTGAGADMFSPRLLAELATAGLATRTQTFSDGPLDTLARKDGCLSGVRALPSGKGVELWLDETANGRPMVRNLVVDERPDGPDVAMVVLQTTELVRAALQGQSATSPGAVADVHQAAPAEPVSAVKHAFLLGAGAGVFKQRGGFPAVPILRVEAAWTLWRGVGPELLLQGPWQTSDLHTLEGTTRATSWGLALGVRVDHTFTRWFAAVGVGLLWQIWQVEGFANSSVIARDQTFTELGIYSHARAGVNLASWLRGGLDLSGGANFSETRIAHAQRDVGAVGQLGAAAVLTIEALSR